MKKFTLLKLVADITEIIAYVELFGGLVLVVLTMSGKMDALPFVTTVGAFLILWITLTLPTLIAAHIIRLGISYYEVQYQNLEIQRDILRELKSKVSEGRSVEGMLKSENRGKSLNEILGRKK
jgi:Na+(H+)/acetate symporter ActP